MNDGQTIFAPDIAEALAKALLPKDVALAVAFPWHAAEGLLAEEVASLESAGPRRLAEFASGRRAAHAAMARLGTSVRAVPHGPDRAPIWPEGLVGSITHNEMICLAAVGYAARHAGLALDVEEDSPLPEDLVPEICTSAELAWLSVQPESERGHLARLIFSAKECAYKLIYPTTRAVLGFDAFEITPDLETGQFEATLSRNVAPFVARSRFAGRFAFGAGLVLTGMAMPHSALS